MTQPSDPTPLTEEQIRAATIGDVTPHAGPILLAEYHESWPRLYRREEERISHRSG